MIVERFPRPLRTKFTHQVEQLRGLHGGRRSPRIVATTPRLPRIAMPTGGSAPNLISFPTHLGSRENTWAQGVGKKTRIRRRSSNVARRMHLLGVDVSPIQRPPRAPQQLVEEESLRARIAVPERMHDRHLTPMIRHGGNRRFFITELAPESWTGLILGG